MPDNEFKEQIVSLSRDGNLYQKTADPGEKYLIQCHACAHRCRISDGKHGLCFMRWNEKGRLRVPWGYVAGLACDPIEKKPFYHFLPGSDALSFGMLGCNFHCPFCQNWTSSQTLRDPEALVSPRKCQPEEIVNLAIQHEAPAIASTYNEPLITSEWALEVFKLAKKRNLFTCYVSNGFASKEVIAYMAPYLDAMNVDLKCFTEEGYRQLGGRLKPVLETIRGLRKMKKWVEVITLIVPGFNDSEDELSRMAEFLASVDPDMPWHVTACHAQYKYDNKIKSTPSRRIEEAAEIGRRAGIRYVYGGNVIGLGKNENTYCHKCGFMLIKRSGFHVTRNLMQSGHCCNCDSVIPGIWQDNSSCE